MNNDEKIEYANRHLIEHINLSDYKLIHQSTVLNTKTYCNGTIHREIWEENGKRYGAIFQCDCHIWEMLRG